MNEPETQQIEVIAAPVIIFTENDAAYAATHTKPEKLKYYDSKLIVFGMADPNLLPDKAILRVEQRGYHRKTGKPKVIAAWHVTVPVVRASTDPRAGNVFVVALNKLENKKDGTPINDTPAAQ